MLVPALLLSLQLPRGAAATSAPPGTAARVRPAAMSAGDMATLHGRLMGKVEAMDKSEQGIFNEEVTGMVAPFFPPGQSFGDAAATVRDQGLGELQPFKGKTGAGDGTMFVSRFSLMSHAFAHVFVVLNFGFRKTTGDTLVLDHVRAFLRSQSM